MAELDFAREVRAVRATEKQKMNVKRCQARFSPGHGALCLPDPVRSKNSAKPETPVIVLFCRDIDSWSESNLSRLQCRFSSSIQLRYGTFNYYSNLKQLNVRNEQP